MHIPEPHFTTSIDAMPERRTRFMLLLTTPALLCACAAQQADRAPPEPVIDAQAQCIRDCELTHSGTVRACSRMRPGTARDGLTVTECIDEAYVTLRGCYPGCEDLSR